MDRIAFDLADLAPRSFTIAQMLTGQPIQPDKIYYFGIYATGIATEYWEVEAFCNMCQMT